MNADLELARAVFPDHKWYAHPENSRNVWMLCCCSDDFDPLGAHFPDVLAWLLGKGFAVTCGSIVGPNDGSGFCTQICNHDGTASGLKQAVYDAAIRVIKEGKV